MTQAITPTQAKEAAIKAVPDFVLEAFNELIVENLAHGRAHFLAAAVVARIQEKAVRQGQQLTERDIYARKWMNVAPAYRRQDWKVVFDEPGYNESYKANFTFTRSND